MTDEPTTPSTAAAPRLDPQVTARLRTFLGVHGGARGATAVVSFLGRSGARVVVVAADGVFADAVVPSVELGEDLAAELGVEVDGWNRDVVARIDLSEADRRAMAGR